MTNALEVTMVRIMYSIPKDILRLAFYRRRDQDKFIPAELVTLDDLILTKVIRGRVLVDLNLMGGKPKQIVLQQAWREKIKYGPGDYDMNIGPFSLYRIPPEERDNVPIVEVTGIAYPGNLGGSSLNITGYGGGTTLGVIANAVLDSITYASSPSRPNPELLAGDLVKLYPSQHAHVNYVLNCRLCYDEHLTNLNTSAIDTFADLCVCAVKAYCYNELVIDIDRAYVEGGAEVATIGRIVESYADENTKYKELKDLMHGAAFLDPQTLEAFYRYAL